MLYLRYWFNVTQTLNWNYIIYRPVTYISWSSDFALYLEDYLMGNVIIGILGLCDAKINHIKCMWVSDLHFVVQWFWLVSWRHFDGEMFDWRYWFSVNKVWPTIIYVGWWPIFCVMEILLYIVNTIWWTSLILWILVSICSIDLYFMIKPFWITSYFCLKWCVEVWYENICECRKVRNRPIVYSRHEAGASVYFGHISCLLLL